MLVSKSPWKSGFVPDKTETSCSPENIKKDLTAPVSMSIPSGQLNSLAERISIICNFVLKNARNTEALEAAGKCQSNQYRLQDLEQIIKLDISVRQLQSLPKEIVLLKNLSKLSAIGNELTSLPDNLNELDSLTTLELNGNKFEEFPEVLCKEFKSLREVFLANNHLLHQLPIKAEKIISYPLPNFIEWI